MLRNVNPEDLKALSQVTRHILDWEGPNFVSDAEEEPGSLVMEVGNSVGASRDPHGEDPLYEEIFLAVYSETDDRLYEVTVADSTREEAMMLLQSMSEILGL